MHLSVLDRECSIAVNMSLLPLSIFDCFSFFLCLLFFLNACPACISMDESCILNHSFLHFVSFLIKLSLQLIPDELLLAVLLQTVASAPDRRKIRYSLVEADKVPERDAVMALVLKLWIAQAIPCLQKHTAHNDKFISMWSAACLVIVIKRISDDRNERLPVNLQFHQLKTVS